MVVAFLPSFAGILQGLETETHLHTAVRHIQPPVGKAELQHLRIVHISVMIMVETFEVTGCMSKYDRTPSVPHLKR